MQLPMPLRAALGVVATARDVVQNLPDKAIELPMLAVSTALQLSLRAQQRYAELAARGDALLGGQRVGDEPPAWATFDDPVETLPSAAPPVTEMTSRSTTPRPTTPRPTTPRTSAPRTPTSAAGTPAAKTVRAPRSKPASKFDAVGDD